MGSTLSAALYYASLGWRILPVWGVKVDKNGNAKCDCGVESCNVQGKHPVSYRGGQAVVPRGVKDATTDHDTIRRWWAGYPSANIGAAATEWFALDIDRQEARYELGNIPDTVESISGSGGQHILFNQPKDWKVGNATGKDLPSGIDVRGCGEDGSPRGYIILAPSMHKSGKRYEWEASSRPDEVPIADAPQWLLDILKNVNMKRVKVEITEAVAPDLAVFSVSRVTRERILSGHYSGEDRSSMDMRVCVALVEASATPSEIAAIFHKYPIGTAGKMADHRSPDDYLQRTIDSAFSYTTAKAPKKVIKSKIQPETMVTEEEAEFETSALNLAYLKGWSDALGENPDLISVLWPEYLQPSHEMVKHYGMGISMEYRYEDKDADYAALIVPYYSGGEITALDLTIHSPPNDCEARMCQTDGGVTLFDTEFDRTEPVTGKVVVTSDFDEAIRLQQMGLKDYDIIGLPANRKQLRNLAEMLSDSELVILAWPKDRRAEGRYLARLLASGEQRVHWASMPASLRAMLSTYTMNLKQFSRILEMSISVV
jgi:hypothetical protein